jgi:hypothetical protein
MDGGWYRIVNNTNGMVAAVGGDTANGGPAREARGTVATTSGPSPPPDVHRTKERKIP